LDAPSSMRLSGGRGRRWGSAWRAGSIQIKALGGICTGMSWGVYLNTWLDQKKTKTCDLAPQPARPAREGRGV
jgi:hypothetical protein